MAQANKKDDEDAGYYVNGKKYPAKPGIMDYAKEAFEPNDVRAQLDVVRKRRAQVMGQSD